MKEIVTSTKFRKDLKRYQKNTDKLNKLFKIVQLLEEGLPIPEENKPHLLKGNYNGYMECHIENDFLLIWFDESSNLIKLVRLGTHSELFDK